MQNYAGRLLEFRLEADGRTAVRVSCPDKAIPAPGQYLLAHAPGDSDAALAGILFPTEYGPGSFIAASPLPETWQIGTPLHLRGPLGKGFRLPAPLRNLALLCLTHSPARLLPLIHHADNTALFTAFPFPNLPASVEINPLEDLPHALRWADFLALEIPLERLPELPNMFGLGDHYLPCPAQALVITPMPCGGLADCGVCAVGGHRYSLACKDGPVFDLKVLFRGK